MNHTNNRIKIWKLGFALLGMMLFMCSNFSGINFLNTASAATTTTYTSTNSETIPIPDNGWAFSKISVPVHGTIEKVKVIINQITHPIDEEVNAYVYFDNVNVSIVTDAGGYGQNFVSTILDDSAQTPINQGYAPFTGTYKPMNQLSAFNGITPYGEWTLFIYDDNGVSTTGYIGINGWSLQIQYSQRPEAPVLDSKELFDSALINVINPRLKFSCPIDSDGDAENFQVQVDDDYNLNSPVISKVSGTDSGFGGDPDNTPPFNQGTGSAWYDVQTGDGLQNGVTYWWHVRAKDSVGYGEWSDKRSFTIDTSAPHTAWYQTTKEQFQTDDLHDAVARGGSNQDVVIDDQPTGEGMLAYADGDPYGTPIIRFWSGTAWSEESNALSAGGTALLYVVLKSNPKRNEYALGTLGSDGHVNVQIYNGYTKTWGNLKEISTSNYDTSYRSFDIEYETTSGDLLAVCRDGNNANPVYYNWNGISWSNSNPLSLGTTGAPAWIVLRSDPASDEIIYGAVDKEYDITAAVWSGSSWFENKVITPENYAETYTAQCFDIAYEQQSGYAMFMWADGSLDTPQYRFWSGSDWDTSDSNVPSTGCPTINWIRLASDPSSDKIAMEVYDGWRTSPAHGYDINVNMWSGSSWETDSERSNADNPSSPQLSKRVDVAFEKSGNEAIAVWYTADTQNYYPDYSRYTSSWQTNEHALGVGGYPRVVQLVPSPHDDQMMLIACDPNNDLVAQKWTGSVWADDMELETNLPTYSKECFMFAYKNHVPDSAVVTSTPIEYSSNPSTPVKWGYGQWNGELGGGTSSIVVKAQYWTGSAWQDITGKESSTPSNPVYLYDLSTTTYSKIRLIATLNKGTGTTPQLKDWSLSCIFSDTDTDSDGMPDWWEVDNNLNPVNPVDAAIDSDTDGLTNIQEYQHGTNPHSGDTDSDTMPDGWEVQYGLNPILNDANTDLDNDGLINIDEFNHGTLPNNPNSDSDNINDGAEVNIFHTNPLFKDSDGDGLSDDYETNTIAYTFEADMGGASSFIDRANTIWQDPPGRYIIVPSVTELDITPTYSGLNSLIHVSVSIPDISKIEIAVTNNMGESHWLLERGVGSGNTYNQEVIIRNLGFSFNSLNSNMVSWHLIVYNYDTGSTGEINTYEIKAHTNPNDYDTDKDGIWDGWHDDNHDGNYNTGEIQGETQYGTNPLSSDTDHDGFTDGEEINVYKSDPVTKINYVGYYITDSIYYSGTPTIQQALGNKNTPGSYLGEIYSHYEIEGSVFHSNWGSPEDLKSALQGQYSNGMVGAVFVGPMPTVYGFSDNGGFDDPTNYGVGGDEMFLSDLYYEDLDGEWKQSKDYQITDKKLNDISPWQQIIVGDYGSIYKFNDMNNIEYGFTSITNPYTNDLLSINNAPQNVIVGKGGIILRYLDGSTPPITKINSGTTTDLNAVSPVGPNREQYIVGNGGIILKMDDNNNIQTINSGTTTNLQCCWLSSEIMVNGGIIGGNNGLLMRLDISTNPPTITQIGQIVNTNLKDITCNQLISNQPILIIVGDSGTILRYDWTNNQLTHITTSVTTNFISAFYQQDNNNAYITDDSGNIYLFSLDTNAVTLFTNVVPNSINSLWIDTDNKIWCVDSSGNIWLNLGLQGHCYPSHMSGTGDVTPEIWVGHLLPPSDDNAVITNELITYFTKAIDYITGVTTRPNKALCYVQDTIDFTPFTPWGLDSAFSDITIVKQSTNGVDYLNRITTAGSYEGIDYEFVHVCSHSSPTYAEIGYTSTQIMNGEIRPLFYNLYQCSNALYTITRSGSGGGYFSGEYVFGTGGGSGLIAISSSKVGGMLPYRPGYPCSQLFYSYVNKGVCLGTAWLNWWQQYDSLDPTQDAYHGGMILIGDPILRT